MSADQNVSLVGVVFSVFLLQNQKQLLKQEHVSLSSLLPHFTHSLHQEMNTVFPWQPSSYLVLSVTHEKDTRTSGHWPLHVQLLLSPLEIIFPRTIMNRLLHDIMAYDISWQP